LIVRNEIDDYLSEFRRVFNELFLNDVSILSNDPLKE
jgi:hypothetical protein